MSRLNAVRQSLNGLTIVRVRGCAPLAIDLEPGRDVIMLESEGRLIVNTTSNTEWAIVRPSDGLSAPLGTLIKVPIGCFLIVHGAIPGSVAITQAAEAAGIGWDSARE